MRVPALKAHYYDVIIMDVLFQQINISFRFISDALVEQVVVQQPPTNIRLNDESSAESQNETPNVDYPNLQANPTINSNVPSNNNFTPTINDNGISNDNLTFADIILVSLRRSTSQSKPPQ